MVPSRYRVVDRRPEMADTVTLALEPVDEPIPQVRPGQFNMMWAFGVGEVPISMSGGPRADGSLLHTIRRVGAVTAALCEAEPGDEIGVRGPFGSDWDVAGAEGGDVVVVGGGIGLAPLRPVIYELLAHRDRFERIALLVGARTPADLLFDEELSGWRSRFDLEVEVTVDAAPQDWHGDVGVVTTLVPRVPFDPGNTTAFLCGPEVMMRFAAKALLDRGVEPSRIRVSLERNMKCAVVQCGHCQLGPVFLCREGPVFDWATAAGLLAVEER